MGFPNIINQIPLWVLPTSTTMHASWAQALAWEANTCHKEEEVCHREAEAHCFEEKAQQALKKAEQLEAGACQAKTSAKTHEAAA